MTETMPATGNHAQVTGEELRGIRFTSAKGFGRGYEAHEVEAFVERCASWIDWLNDQLKASHDQVRELESRGPVGNRPEDVLQAITVLTGAQQAADMTVAKASEYSERVMAEAKELYESSRRRASALEQEAGSRARAIQDEARALAEALHEEAETKARALHEQAHSTATSLSEEAAARAAALDAETKAKIAAMDEEARARYEEAQARSVEIDDRTEAKLKELGITAAQAQEELDKQTYYLRTLRDASLVQMQKFLEGLLDHIAGEYGRANPVAAGAVVTVKPVTAADSAAKVKLNPSPRRRPLRLAGMPPGPRPLASAPASASSEPARLPAPRAESTTTAEVGAQRVNGSPVS